MTVRELIIHLLDYDMDFEVEIETITNNDTNWHSLEIGENNSAKEVYLVVDLGEQVLVDADRLEELEELGSESD